jgi:hypothetical protein
LSSQHNFPVESGEDVADIFISLDKILNHPAFKSSPQLSSFLYYVVSEEIAGRGEKIKAYTVAVDALGRPESFDPSSDPVIRVVANRLRKALDRFYSDMGDTVPIRIKLVKGSYRPVFVPRGSEEDQQPDTPASTFEESGRTSPAKQGLSRFCITIIVVLSVLLALSVAYVGWDLMGFSPDNIGINAGGRWFTE